MKKCGCPGCVAGLKPFTVEHFRVWAADLVLDSGEKWVVEDYFEAFLEDYFAGIPELWLLIPEGNAKTTNFAGLGDYLLEHRTYAAIPWAASSRDQAEIGYRQAEGFVLRSPRLSKFLKCQEGYRRIKNLETGGRLQVFAADDRTGDGIIPTDAFLDELHRHRSLALYRTWRGKLPKRGGQLATISTAGIPGEEFEEVREQIRQETPQIERRDGYVHCRSDRIALHDYSVPEEADVEDMAVVKQANPFSKITVSDLEEKYAAPTMTLAHWRRFTCNLPTRAENAAITEEEWFGAQVEDEIPEGEPVDVGLDLGWKKDDTGIVPLWVRDEQYRLFDKVQVLSPPRNGQQLDPRLVENALEAIHRRNPIQTLVMDMSNGETIANWAEGELHVEVIDRGQSNAFLVPDYEKFMEALREGWIKHTGNRDFTRHVLNAVARPATFGDLRFDRPALSRDDAIKQRVRCIDSLQAAAMVHHFAAGSLGASELMVAFV